MKKLRAWSTLLLALLLASLLAGCGAEPTPTALQPTQPPAATLAVVTAPPTDTPAAVAPTPAGVDVAAIYLRLCKSCHGKQREGFAKFPPLTPTDLADLTDDQLREVLVKGRALTNMRGFDQDMKPEEIEAMIQFLRSPVE